jgi:hypothetical protein
MTFLEAAVEVLRRSGRPLPVQEISTLAIRQKLLTHIGRDPEGTMKARLEAELGRPPALARVTAIRPGVFTLTEAAASVPSPPEVAPEATPPAPVAAPGRRRRRTQKVATQKLPERPAEEPPVAVVDTIEVVDVAVAAGDGVASTAAEAGEGGEAGGRSRRRRRRGGRRSKRGGQGRAEAAPARAVEAVAPKAPPPRAAAEAAPAQSNQGRVELRSLADAAYRILREHTERRPVHYRQIAEMAMKRRLVPGDLSDPRRAMKIALLDDLRWRRARGLRPRFWGDAGGLFALTNGRLDGGLVETEERVAAAARDLREATRRALAARLRALPLEAVEQVLRRALARRFGVEPTAVERQPGHVLLEAGGEGDRVLLRLQTAPPERGQLRALGDRCRQQSRRGMIVSLADVPPAETSQGAAAGVQVLGGAALAALLADAGVGVVTTAVAVEYLDDDLLDSLVES